MNENDAIRLNMAAQVAAGMLAGQCVDAAKLTVPKYQEELAQHVAAIVNCLVASVAPTFDTQEKEAETHSNPIFSKNPSVIAAMTDTNAYHFDEATGRYQPSKDEDKNIADFIDVSHPCLKEKNAGRQERRSRNTSKKKVTQA